VFLGLLAWARPRLSTLIAVVLLNGAVSYAVPHLWSHLHDYQRRRIETFLNPARILWIGLSDHPIEDRDRLGGSRQRIPARHAEGSRLPADASHRLHLLAHREELG